MSKPLSSIFAYRFKSGKPLNYREKLDFVLFALRNHDEEQRYAQLLNNVNLRYNVNVSIPEYKRILHKLEKDGFILVEKVDLYSITLDGYYFKGYVIANKNLLRRNHLLSFRDWTLAIGTGMAGLYGLFEILKWCYHHFYWMQILKFWH